jgi:hypothetical protein
MRHVVTVSGNINGDRLFMSRNILVFNLVVGSLMMSGAYHTWTSWHSLIFFTDFEADHMASNIFAEERMLFVRNDEDLVISWILWWLKAGLVEIDFGTETFALALLLSSTIQITFTPHYLKGFSCGIHVCHRNAWVASAMSRRPLLCRKPVL